MCQRNNHIRNKISNQTKQNMMINGYIKNDNHFKKKIKKNYDQSYQEHQKKNINQLRNLCQQQEKLILAQYQSRKHDYEFYGIIKNQLSGNKICHKILRIKEMSNQEAQEQLQCFQNQKSKNDFVQSSNYYQTSKYSYTCQGQQQQNQQKGIFKQYMKQISMIQDNDDSYLDQLGDVIYRQNHQIQDQQQKHQQDLPHFNAHRQSLCYQNDDIFDL